MRPPPCPQLEMLSSPPSPALTTAIMAPTTNRASAVSSPCFNRSSSLPSPCFHDGGSSSSPTGAAAASIPPRVIRSKCPHPPRGIRHCQSRPPPCHELQPPLRRVAAGNSSGDEGLRLLTDLCTGTSADLRPTLGVSSGCCLDVTRRCKLAMGWPPLVRDLHRHLSSTFFGACHRPSPASLTPCAAPYPCAISRRSVPPSSPA
ncbi:hypothetical protein VPH35_043731 [Triticum aestivum]